jgi:hypothetical protein
MSAIQAGDVPTLNQNTTGTAAGLSSTLAVASGGTGLTSYTTNGVLYASGTGTLANGSGFVFDGTNVGVGESSPSTYGKFVVAGTGSFTNALVSTSSTLTDRPLLEFRKTMNVTSGQTSVIGRLSFNGKLNSTAGEQAYISVTSQNLGGIIDSNVIKLASRSLSVGIDSSFVSIGGGVTIDGGNLADIQVGSTTINYTADTHNFYGDIASPDLTGTPTTPTAALNTNTTQIASTAFVQSALSQYIKVHTVNTTTGASYSNGTGSYTDLLTLTITPKSASSKFFLIASASFSCVNGGGNGAEVALVRNSTTLLNQYNGHALNNSFNASFAPNVVDSPATTSAITYRIQAKREGADTISNLGTYSFTVIEYS